VAAGERVTVTAATTSQNPAATDDADDAEEEPDVSPGARGGAR
jgi:hypothetical protein